MKEANYVLNQSAFPLLTFSCSPQQWRQSLTGLLGKALKDSFGKCFSPHKKPSSFWTESSCIYYGL